MKKNIWQKSLKVIPGGNTLISKRPNLWLPNSWPTHFIKADGIRVTSSENKTYRDFLFAVGTNTLGYSNKHINSSVIKAIKNGTMTSLNCKEEYLLAEELLKINHWADMVKFTRGGGEANAIAIRIARAASGRENVAFCGYHSWHDWYVSSNLNSKNVLNNYVMSGIETDGVPKALKGTIFPFEYNNLIRLKKLISEKKIGTVIMEVKRYVEPENNFLQKVRKLCSKNNIVLIFDECTSGFRQNYGGIYKDYNVTPDMIMYGKALGNGFAIAAVLGKKSIMESANNSFISSSFWGERVGFVAGLKTLEIMRKTKSWKKIKSTGKYVLNQINQIAKRNKIKLRTMGLPSIPTFVFEGKYNLHYKTLIAQEFLKKKMLGSNLFFLSTAHSKKDIDDYLNELDNIFYKISLCSNPQKLKKFLKHKVVDTTFKRLN